MVMGLKMWYSKHDTNENNQEIDASCINTIIRRRLEESVTLNALTKELPRHSFCTYKFVVRPLSLCGYDSFNRRLKSVLLRIPSGAVVFLYGLPSHSHQA